MTLSVTKLRPGEQTMTRASAIRMRFYAAQFWRSGCRRQRARRYRTSRGLAGDERRRNDDAAEGTAGQGTDLFEQKLGGAAAEILLRPRHRRQRNTKQVPVCD